MVTSKVTINFYLAQDYPVPKSRIILREWSFVFRVPPEAPWRMFSKDPDPVAGHEFRFDYQTSRGGWCWRAEEDETLLTTGELADHILKVMIDRHERIEKKKTDPDYDPGQTSSGP